MKRFAWHKPLAGLGLLVVLFFGLATPVQAFTPRSGDQVVIEAGEVIQDDVYVIANTVVVRGTIQGDLVALASAVIIEDSGTVTGDLLAAGQGVVIKGRVGDTARIAGAVLAVGPEASIGSDLVAAGYNLDLQRGGQIGQDLVTLASGVSIRGRVGRNAQVQSEGLALSGQIGGSLSVSAGAAGDGPSFNITSFFPTQPALPAPAAVTGGLEMDPKARIGGSLAYTAPKEISVPTGVVNGKVVYTPPPPEMVTPAPPPPTTSEKALDWLAGILRSLVALLFVGLLLSYFFPDLLRRGADALQARPVSSLGWGLLTYVGFFFLLSLVFAVAILLMILFGTISLNDLMWTTLGIGVMAFTLLIVVFKIAVSYLSKVIVGYLAGRLIFSRLLPSQAGSRIWPALVGILLFVLLIQIPVVGGILNFVEILFGLGALFLLARDSYQRLAWPEAV